VRQGVVRIVTSFDLLPPVVCLFAIGCASQPRPRPATAAAVRMQDSAPEKIAAQRAASGNLQLEQEDARWGFDAARARRKPREPATKASVIAPLPAPATPAQPPPAPETAGSVTVKQVSPESDRTRMVPP
jgi:hypothetical protein